MLLAAEVFEAKEWTEFSNLLPDLNFVSTFGCTGAGSEDHGVPGITARMCLMYVHGTTLLHKALWADAPQSIVSAILEKCQEDPLKRDVLSHASEEEGMLPLHIAAGACDDFDVVKELIDRRPAALLSKDMEGNLPIDIIRRGGRVEGMPERINAGAILKLFEAEQKKAKCGNQICGKKAGAAGVTLKACGACKSVSYCSVACQKGDWKLHKRCCAPRAKK